MNIFILLKDGWPGLLCHFVGKCHIADFNSFELPRMFVFLSF